MVEVWLQQAIGRQLIIKHTKTQYFYSWHVHTCTHTHIFFLHSIMLTLGFSKIFSVSTSVIKINNLNANSDVSLCKLVYSFKSTCLQFSSKFSSPYEAALMGKSSLTDHWNMMDRRGQGLIRGSYHLKPWLLISCFWLSF